MVNLTIRLSKDAGLGAGAASSKVAAGVELAPLVSSGPPACLDHLESDELTAAAAVGSPTFNATVNILGRKCQRKLGSKVHFCVRCNFPIAIYGRLDPCEHVFCLICAKKDPICFLCEERIIRIQKLEILEGVYICGAPGCLKSFIKKPELEGHIKDTHKALLHRTEDRDERAEIFLQIQSRPEQMAAVQGQSLSVFPPLPPQPRQPQPQPSEDKLVQGHARQSPSISSNFQREEKQSRSHQQKFGSHQQDRHGHQRQQQQHPQHQERHQHSHISPKKSQQNIHDNHPQNDHHQHHPQQLQQHQGQQEKPHRSSHLEKQQLQHPERSSHTPPQNQHGMLPPFLPQPFSSYDTVSDKNHLQHPRAVPYDSPKFVPSVDYRMSVHPGVSEFKEKSRPRHSETASFGREGALSSNGNQEGFMPIGRQPLSPHYSSEYGLRAPQMTGKELDHPPHFQDAAKLPASKRGKYGPSPPIGEPPADTLASAWINSTSKVALGPDFVG